LLQCSVILIQCSAIFATALNHLLWYGAQPFFFELTIPLIRAEQNYS
jgi:hypothetical protein